MKEKTGQLKLTMFGTNLTHGIHNVYPAKFIPQVLRFVIKKFNLKRKIILDTFAGLCRGIEL